VDLLLTLNPGTLPQNTARTATTATTGTEGLPITQLMLQDVLVLQVGTWATGTDKNAAPGSVVTFVLDRQDALTLKSAREQGQIDLALRKAGDHKPVTTEPVSLQYLNKRFNFNLQPAVTGR
jgi:Flp pilus assembly protein CpaB